MIGPADIEALENHPEDYIPEESGVKESENQKERVMLQMEQDCSIQKREI